ncbi:MAG: hypothetical protein JWN40_880 [Phycisphaerales bacterium]|nr:hypothetical protein [Phycisphaerales bacterium]
MERPVFEQGGATEGAAEALARARPGEFEYTSGADIATRPDSRWAALSARFRITQSYAREATVFLHELWTPDGRRRLVVLEYAPRWADRVYVVEPASGWMTGEPRLLLGERVAWGDDIKGFFVETVRLDGPDRVWAGVPDRLDRSRFRVAFLRGGVAGTFEYRLGDDDRLTMRLLDADVFVARAQKQQEIQERMSPPGALMPPAGRGE